MLVITLSLRPIECTTPALMVALDFKSEIPMSWEGSSVSSKQALKLNLSSTPNTHVEKLGTSAHICDLNARE